MDSAPRRRPETGPSQTGHTRGFLYSLSYMRNVGFTVPSEPCWVLVGLLYILSAAVAGIEAAVLVALITGGFGAVSALMVRLSHRPRLHGGTTSLRSHPAGR